MDSVLISFYLAPLSLFLTLEVRRSSLLIDLILSNILAILTLNLYNQFWKLRAMLIDHDILISSAPQALCSQELIYFTVWLRVPYINE